MTPEDDADSFLRAVAAAPAKTPPVRAATVAAIEPGDAAPCADQVDAIRSLIEVYGGELTDTDGVIVVFADALRAAECAIELREVLAGARIALATGPVAHGPTGTAAIAARAVALLGEEGPGIRLDDETAECVAPKFELEVGPDGSKVLLVEPRASRTPSRSQKVIGNYKIVRLLGTGGMGVVYLAEHVAIGRKAVIKFVQEKLVSREIATRFFLEAKTAATIRHPGIVDVFDYGHDDAGRGYIVMEFLDGENLRARLKREKPLRLDLAMALGTQIASALAAAHAAGVIHRDLKPDNLFLVADPEAYGQVRAKVLDFGLAKLATSPEVGLTGTGNFVGTPLYMSPEQCRASANIDHRTDVYSLGCVLFEMLTGRPPFLDKTVGDLIIAHNSNAAPSPTSLRSEIPLALDRAIQRALAKAPSDRFASMEEFGAELARIAKGLGTPGLDQTVVARPKGAAPKPARRRPWLPIAIGVIAIAASVVAYVALRSPKSKLLPAVDPEHRAVAVLQLENQSGAAEAAWLSTALAVVLTRDLGDGGELRVVPAEDVARMKADRKLAGPWTRERLGEVRAALGAHYAITGGYIALGAQSGGQVRLDLELFDTATGEVMAKVSEIGAESDLFELGARADATFKRELGVTATAAPERGLLPKSSAAARPYSEALAKMQTFDVTAARDLLAQAANIEPDDPAIHFALARVWSELGYDAKAAGEAKLAFDRASGLPREYQLAIEAKYRETTGQWDQAIQAYKTLFEFYPKNLEYGLALAAAQTRAGDAKSAYVTLDALRKLGADPRIDLYEAIAAESADDAERERLHAERAAFLANKTGARLLLAKARFRQGWAEFTLGRDSDANAHYEEARKIFVELGDRSGLARVLNNVALVAHRAHRDADAARNFEEALAIAREIKDTVAEAWVLNNWAYLVTDQGDLARAIELYLEKIALGAERGVAPASLAAAHANITEIARWRGDLVTAREHCNTADDLVRGVDARRFAAFAAVQCGELMRAEDDLPGARKRIQQALGWASDPGSAETAEIRIALARVELDSGHLAEAETAARAAVDSLRAAKEGSQRVCAISVLASALIARSRLDDAKRELDAVAALPAEGVSLACRIEADLAMARVTMATNRTAGATALEAVRTRAERSGFVQHHLQTRLAAKTDLTSLSRDATAKGFKLIARQAREAK